MRTSSLIPAFLLLILSCWAVSCRSGRDITGKIETKDDPAKSSSIEEQPAPDTVKAGTGTSLIPPVIIYKTRGDFNNNIPVSLSSDGKTLLSYPGVKDVYYQGAFAVPTLLEDGFLLDNRGVDSNTVFLDYTYESYSTLSRTPLPEEIIKHVTAVGVIEVMYLCKCARDTAFLNNMIRRNDFSSCKRIR